ncbi:MAG: type VI secretion system protein TssA [Bryobacteraceae bacterium]
MADTERFLEPVPGDAPTGKYLKYAPLYPEIEEARRREDPTVVAKMNLGRDAKAADFKRVIKLAEDALVSKTKDLQIAAWLVEAWTVRDGIQGLLAGIRLLQELLNRFWDGLYPEVEEGDTGLRSMPLNWLGSSFDVDFAVRNIPLTTPRSFTWLQYQESKQVGYEVEVKGNAARQKARDEAIKEGKLAPEDFDKDFDATPKSFYKELSASCASARDLIRALEAFCDEKFADDPPSFSPLSKALEEVKNVVATLLARKLEKDPDPVEAPEAEAEAPAEGESGETEAAPGARTPDALAKLDGQIASADQASLHVIAAAEFLRRKSPASPVGYLLPRALRWGEMRAAPNPLADLPAPSAQVRTTLKNSAAGNNWQRVLDTAEAAISSSCGRGWLDAQRYSIKACDQLGYTAAAKALRVELKAFLAEFPELPAAVLGDDTGTANPETLAWLKQEGLIA